MSLNASEIGLDAVCLIPGVGGPSRNSARSHGGGGLFERQLAATGLEAVAKKAAHGSVLELDDAVLLCRASLPLLGRIVQLCPAGARSTGFCRKTSDEKCPDDPPPEGGTTSAALPRQIAQPLTDWEEFCRRLCEIRCEIAATDGPVAWYPELGRPPDECGSADDGYTGVDVLRAVALARLLLPATVEVVAPLAALGPKLAQVALEFGATHLGYVAAEGQCPDSPLVVSQNALDELQNSCSHTLLREE